MKSVTKARKTAAKATMNASKRSAPRRVLALNSSKQIDSEWYYSLADMEQVVAAVLAELDSDPGAAITLDNNEVGVILNVTSTDGDEFTVDVELDTEGDEVPEAAEDNAEDESEAE